MDDMITITLNDSPEKVKAGQPILIAARKKNVYIPTLCNNDALVPYGACRMCLVEIERAGRTRVVTSCNYPAEEGLIVRTDTEKVVKTRNVIMELLLARAPKNKTILALADRLGVKGGRLVETDDDCIVCGQCVRACSEVVGVNALGFSYRGPKRMPTTPFAEASETCIGCGSCVWVCPTNYIKMEDRDGKRYIYNWKVEFELATCKNCGMYIGPKRQLDYIRKIANLPEDFYDLCFSCR